MDVMTKQERAEQWSRKGPVKMARALVELEDQLDQTYTTIGKMFAGHTNIAEVIFSVTEPPLVGEYSEIIAAGTVLADIAAAACTGPSGFCSNKDDHQQALSLAVARWRLLISQAKGR